MFKIAYLNYWLSTIYYIRIIYVVRNKCWILKTNTQIYVDEILKYNHNVGPEGGTSCLGLESNLVLVQDVLRMNLPVSLYDVTGDCRQWLRVFSCLLGFSHCACISASEFLRLACTYHRTQGNWFWITGKLFVSFSCFILLYSYR